MSTEVTSLPLPAGREGYRVGRPLHERVRDTRGKFLTVALFYETAPASSRYQPLYTLAEQDKPGLPSARRIYLELGDPTEYQAAMALVGSWEHWQYLCTIPWFQEVVEDWRQELQAMIKSRAVTIAKNLARGDDATALSASKWLHAQMPSTGPLKKRVGRPNKEAAEVQETSAADLNSDYERMRTAHE